MIFNLTQPVLDSAPKFTYTGTYEYIDDGGGNWRIKFLSSGVFTPLKKMTIDAFLVGGGGAGGGGSYGAGGAGGYTNTVKAQTIDPGAYSIVIGAGGASAYSNGNASTAFGFSANGGGGGVKSSVKGGSGGSGGGASIIGTSINYAPGAGGSDGGNGGANSNNVGAGSGQGSTTREFGESAGTLYAGGGGGAGYRSGGAGGAGGGGRGGTMNSSHTDGTDNTGGGGGGGYSLSANFGKGGSGIVIIRKHKEASA